MYVYQADGSKVEEYQSAQKFGETWLDPEELAYNSPNGSHSRSNRKAFVRFEDGQLRKVTVGVADTFFSCPAHGKVRGKYVSGFIADKDGELHFYPVKKEEGR